MNALEENAPFEQKSYPYIEDDDNILVISKPLAKLLGLSKSIVFRQILYWIKLNKKSDNRSKFHDGCWWTYNTYQQWKDDNFEFWAHDTIRRNLTALRQTGLIYTSTAYNQRAGDQTIWYTINFGAYEAFVRLWRDHGCPMHGDGAKTIAYKAFIEDWEDQKKDYTRIAFCTPQYGILHTPPVQNALSVTRDYSENSSDNKNLRPNAKAQSRARRTGSSSKQKPVETDAAPEPPNPPVAAASPLPPARERFTVHVYGGQDTYADGKFIDPMKPDFVDACNDLFYAWLDALTELGRKPDTRPIDLWSRHMMDIKALAMNRRAPQEVADFIRFAYSDKYPGAFYKNSYAPITFGAISAAIGVWLKEREAVRRNQSTTQAVESAPVIRRTPDELQDLERIKQEALAELGGGA